MKKLAIDYLKENCPEGSVLLSFDEKGKTPVKHHGGMKWCMKDENYRIPYNQKVKGLFDIFAVKNIHSKERHFKFYDWKNSFIVVDFVEWLSREIYPNKNIYIILDGWSCHTSSTFMAYIDTHPRIRLVPLPKTSSWMNDIERDFSRIQSEVLNNSNFESPMQAIGVITKFFTNILNFS